MKNVLTKILSALPLLLILTYLGLAVRNNLRHPARGEDAGAQCEMVESLYLGVDESAPAPARAVDAALLGQLRSAAFLERPRPVPGRPGWLAGPAHQGRAWLLEAIPWPSVGDPVLALTVVDRCNGVVLASASQRAGAAEPRLVAVQLRSQLSLPSRRPPYTLHRMEPRIADDLPPELSALALLRLRQAVLSTHLVQWVEPPLLALLAEAGSPLPNAPAPDLSLLLELAGSPSNLWGNLEVRVGAGGLERASASFRGESVLSLFADVPVLISTAVERPGAQPPGAH